MVITAHYSLRKKLVKMKAVDLTGAKVGRLTVIEFAEKKNGRRYWKCKCECGGEIDVLTTSLATGRTASCGCYQREKASQMFKEHGQSGTRLYRIWSNMIQRCTNPKHDWYSRYGENGISVCDEWKRFDAFHSWAMSNGYSDSLSIDRIDNSKGYSPNNCRWATPQEQTDNRECSIYISFNGDSKTLKEWSKDTGIPYKNLLWRIRRGWDAERALTTK